MQPIKNPEKFELFHVAKGIMFTYVYHPPGNHHVLVGAMVTIPSHEWSR